MVDGEHYDGRNPDVPCPWPLALVQVGESFSLAPWDVEQAPADRLLYYMRVMGVRGAARSEMAGLEPDEAFYREE